MTKHPHLQGISLTKLPHLQPRAGSAALATAAAGSMVAVASTLKHSLPQVLGQGVVQPVIITAQGSRHTSAVYAAYAQFAAGAIGGGTATYSTHWLDTIKVKMQASPTAYPNGMCCLKDTLKVEGVKGLYQGATPALVGHTCKAAIVFTCYGLCEEAVKNLMHDSYNELTVAQHATAGAMTGILASFILCPIELVKCRLQAVAPGGNISAQTRQSPLGIVRGVVVKEGVTGLYRGLTGIWTKEIPGSFIYFGSYETAKSFIRDLKNNKNLSPSEVFLCGVIAGICFCATHPIESVKTRVQIMPESRGFFRGFMHIMKTEGAQALCSGLRPQLLRSSMYSGIQFVTYEAVKGYFLGDVDNN